MKENQRIHNQINHNQTKTRFRSSLSYVCLALVSLLCLAPLYACSKENNSNTGSSATTTTAAATSKAEEKTDEQTTAAASSEASTAEAATPQADEKNSEATALSSKTYSGNITQAGSSALLPMAKVAADLFSKMNDGLTIDVTGGGSGAGLKQLADGSIDIADSDVPASTKLDPAFVEKLQEYKMATMTVAVIVNKTMADQVKNITTDQLIGVYQSKITNWKELGGPDLPIQLITRPATSGTRALFVENALNGQEEEVGDALETDDSGTLVQTVADNEGAIGYVAYPYLAENADKIAGLSIDGVEPTLENTASGKYKVWGYEYMYCLKDAPDHVKAYLDYICSEAFAPEIKKMHYVPLTEMKVEK